MDFEKRFKETIETETPAEQELPLESLPLEEQATILGRIREGLRDRAKPLIMALSLMTLAASEMALASRGAAEEIKEQKPALSEREKTQEKISDIDTREAITVWERIRSLPDNPAALSPGDNNIKKREVARKYIQILAGRIKVREMMRTGTTKEDVVKMGAVKVGGSDFDRAIGTLKSSVPGLCAKDKQIQTCSSEQIEEVTGQLMKTAGGEAFAEMTRERESIRNLNK